jgi:hypothetical protein
VNADGGMSARLSEDGDGSPSDPRVEQRDSNNTNSNELRIGNRGSNTEMEQDPQSDQGTPSVTSKKSPGGGQGSHKSGVKKSQIKG